MKTPVVAVSSRTTALKSFEILVRKGIRSRRAPDERAARTPPQPTPPPCRRGRGGNRRAFPGARVQRAAGGRQGRGYHPQHEHVGRQGAAEGGGVGGGQRELRRAERSKGER